jgi:hypothetical protein
VTFNLSFTHRVPFSEWNSGGSRLRQPIVPVLLRVGDAEVSMLATLDSGADACLFHSDYAEALGLDIYTGRATPVSGISGGTMMPWTHDVELEVGGIALGMVPVDFSADMGDDFTDQLVGRTGVFERLRVGFWQSRNLVFLGRDPGKST